MKLGEALQKVKYVVAYNAKFDWHIICSELYRSKFHNVIKIMEQKELICAMEKSIPLKAEGSLKPTKLVKVYKFLFGKEFDGQHNAKYVVMATAEVFRELIKRHLVCI